MLRKLCPILIVLGCLATVVGLTVASHGRKEPHYEGLTLSEWFVTSYQGRQLVDMAKRDVAVREMGTNALPQLMKWLNLPTSGWRTWLFNHSPSVIRKRIGSHEWYFYFREKVFVSNARTGFLLLGPAAAPAVPELAKVATRWPSPNADAAMDALVAIGPASTPTLLRLFSQARTDPLKVEIMNRLCSMGHQATLAVPTLVKRLKAQT